ncbi:MAG: transglutaminase domain-containing protein [Chloroflexi bacterium]|nr:transglutaminase domain-containing protein [Chloroflexota bacterium]
MVDRSHEPLIYYAAPGPFTALSADETYAPLLEDLPADIPALVRAVQGNLLHIFWAEAYGVTHTDEQREGVGIRSAAEKLRRIHAANPAPLTTPRPPEARLVGNCRDFSVLLCALLRYHGIPARARCGFGTYFTPGRYEDHWVCEYWRADEGRWVMVDAQLDALQRDTLKIDFDPLDVPRDRFITGGHGWQLVRTERADPEKFGIFDMKGQWFIVGNLLRDLAALNKMELLPWDCWGAMPAPQDAVTPAMESLYDRAAAVSWGDNDTFDGARALYDTEELLRVPPTILDVGGDTPREVTLAEEAGVAF